MTNPFMAALGGGQMPGPVGQFQHMMQQFNQFKSNFNGDPKAEVEKLLQSGRLNQQQLNAMQMQNQECLKKLFTKVKDGLKSLLSFDSYKAVGTCAA